MKKSITFIMALLFVAMSFAQNEYINYKAVVKDINGDLVANQTVGIQFTIFEDVGPAYVENHTTISTDANGMLIVDIGGGTATTGTFAAIDWTKYTNLMVEIDIDGGLDNLVDMGTTEFKSVPYALNAGNVSGLEALDEGFGIGWRLIGQNPDNYGDIGGNAVNLSISDSPSTTKGATGLFSIAIGPNTTASGNSSTAMGASTTASGDASTAMGFATSASGFGATAIGIGTVASGTNSIAIGAYNIDDSNAALMIGNGADNGNRSNALTVLKNGTIMAPSLTNTLIETAGSKALVTKEYADAQAGAFSTTANVTSNAPGNITTDDFVFGSTQMAHNFGTDNRMFFDKGKGAFRAGSTDDFGNFEAWDNTNVGVNSFAVGQNTEASGPNSFAAGEEVVASGSTSIAMGLGAQASGTFSAAIGASSKALGDQSTAIGPFSEANSFSSTAIGFVAKADAYASTALGIHNIGGGNATTYVPTDPLLEIGNGTFSTASNAMTILKNGNVGLGAITAPVQALELPLGAQIKVGNAHMSDTFGFAIGNTGTALVGLSNTSWEPIVNGTAQLGTATFAWNDLYVVNPVNVTSDKRLKKDINTLGYGLDAVMSLNPVSYKWKKGHDDLMLGFLAQEVEQVIPEAVTHTVFSAQDRAKYEASGKTLEGNDIYGMNYSELTPVIVKAMQEQQKQIKAQQVLIEQLMTRIEAVENN